MHLYYKKLSKLVLLYFLSLGPLGGTCMFCISASKHLSKSVMLVIICFVLELLVFLLYMEMLVRVLKLVLVLDLCLLHKKLCTHSVQS